MINHTYINHLPGFVGKSVTLHGWVYNKRSSGKIWFLILRDGTGYCQCVFVKGEISDKVFEYGETITQESSATVTGVVREDRRAEGGYELSVTNFIVHQIAEEFPISKKEHGTAFLMDNRHLWLRSKKQHAIMLIRNEVIRASHNYLYENGFTQVDTPIFTANSCEGTTTLFETEYFGRKAYLSQSGQLYNEAAAMAVGKTYCFGPTFRAEKSKTRRHLTEFWMIEPEIAFCDLNENIQWAEGLLVYIVQQVLKNRKEQLSILERNTSVLERVQSPFPQISYTDAVDILKNSGDPFQWGDDFSANHESIISNRFDRPVVVHRFPSKIKAFYMKRDPENEELALGMDIIAPDGYGEIVGGGQREDQYEKLLSQLNEHKLPVDAFQWYLDLRKYGSVPHSGFGIGLERTVTWICGLEHLRETIAFPRMIYRLEP